MNSIFITGSSGFVGLNLIEYLRSFFIFIKYEREASIEINQDIVIHLAGKAHDIKKTSNSEDYYQINTELTKTIFDAFLTSNAKVFITLSSVKAVADEVDGVLTEGQVSNPITHYGKSKLLAERYILSKQIPEDKRVYILRPCMIHGPGNKGNLNLLYKLVSKGIPWPLGSFNNKRSYCSIDNLMFIIKKLIDCEDIPCEITKQKTKDLEFT
jgi:nucleoside-diphosphate-sugar epimerase